MSPSRQPRQPKAPPTSPSKPWRVARERLEATWGPPTCNAPWRLWDVARLVRILHRHVEEDLPLAAERQRLEDALSKLALQLLTLTAVEVGLKDTNSRTATKYRFEVGPRAWRILERRRPQQGAHPHVVGVARDARTLDELIGVLQRQLGRKTTRAGEGLHASEAFKVANSVWSAMSSELRAVKARGGGRRMGRPLATERVFAKALDVAATELGIDNFSAQQLAALAVLSGMDKDMRVDTWRKRLEVARS